MRRLFWVALGATAGVLVVRRLSRAAQAYTPEGLGRSVASLADGFRDLADAVREGMAEREEELRIALGVDTGDVDPAQARALLEDPAGGRRY
ncbi:MAG TPA: DUF6167 family protein [Kineosporiaceae bacterium]|nr:DUF6167 family protein [Kineosporiaceae bacterium]